MKKKYKVGDYVKVEWVDSKGLTNEWEFCDEIKPLLPSVVVSVGILVDDASTYKTIAHSINEEGGNRQLIGRMTIPFQAIKNVERLVVDVG